jgi:hypothetical protein
LGDEGSGMNLNEPSEINCPYCGEAIEMTVDSSVRSQEYIEDCSVCCRPIHLKIEIDEDGSKRINADSEDSV